MNSVVIEQPGLLSSIQDEGRFNLRHLGIPWSGCLTPLWQKLANALVNNPLDNSVIECWEGGFHFRTGKSAVRFAVAAHSSVQMSLDNGTQTVPLKANRSYTAATDTTFVLKSTGTYRHAIIAIEGLSVKPQLSSASTYAKASLGGLSGAALNAGDSLQVALASSVTEQLSDFPLDDLLDSSELRIILGPQADHFSADGLSNLLSEIYTVGSDADRMGVRLSGSPVHHVNAAAKDIVSDAIVPGSIQVPGTGLPIVLLNDAHTAGGYPKVATVISIDLPLLGLHRAGTAFRFKEVSIDEAIDAQRQLNKVIEQLLGSLRPVADFTVSANALFSNNLIDGVYDANDL